MKKLKENDMKTKNETIDNESLEAASDVYDDVVTGNHYQKQADALIWLKNNWEKYGIIVL